MVYLLPLAVVLVGSAPALYFWLTRPASPPPETDDYRVDRIAETLRMMWDLEQQQERMGR